MPLLHAKENNHTGDTNDPATATAVGHTTPPTIGFGCATLGQLYGSLQDGADCLVRSALLHGVTHFDTSPHYGDSEVVLGQALQGLPRSDYTLSSKGGRVGSHFDFSVGAIEQSLTRTLARLQTDYLDEYYLHDVEFATEGQLSELLQETLPFLARERQRGRILRVGISCHPISTAIRVLASGAGPLVDTVLCYGHTTLLDGSSEQLLRSPAWRSDLQFTDASPFGLGILSGHPLPDWHPASQEQRRLLAQVTSQVNDELQASGGASVASAALEYSLRLSTARRMLVGFRSTDEIAKACEIRNRCLEPASDSSHRLFSMLTRAFAPLASIPLSLEENGQRKGE